MDDFYGLKKSIPKDLFEKSESHFLWNTIRSILICSLGFIVGYNYFIDRTLLHLVVYSLIQGTLLTSLWTLGHDCGHFQFSKFSWKNDVLGFLLHTFLLVPYFQWQHSHAIHHKYTGNIDYGETHIPPKKNGNTYKKLKMVKDLFGETGFVFFYLFNTLFLGWYLYLFFGLSGSPKRSFTSHFFVPNKLFEMNTAKKVVKYVLSMSGLIGMGVIFYHLSQVFTWNVVFQMYFCPYIIVNVWLVLYTLLHHVDTRIPYYGNSVANWFDGNLCTIDRKYNDLINWLHFDIGRYHVCHHLFSNMPHYNQKKATEYIQSYLKEHNKPYFYSEKPIFSEIISVAKNCPVVEKSGDNTDTYRFTSVE
jgi:fatty acid desaturase